MARFKGFIQQGVVDQCLGLPASPPTKGGRWFWVTDEVIQDYLYGYNSAVLGGDALKEALLVCLEQGEDD